MLTKDSKSEVSKLYPDFYLRVGSPFGYSKQYICFFVNGRYFVLFLCVIVLPET